MPSVSRASVLVCVQFAQDHHHADQNHQRPRIINTDQITPACTGNQTALSTADGAARTQLTAFSVAGPWRWAGKS